MSEANVDWAKASEYAAVLEEYQKAKQEKIKLFDPKDIVKTAKELMKMRDPELGLLNYGHLTMEDLFEVSEGETPNERNAIVIWKMLVKAYPDTTLDDVKAMPASVTARLLQIFNADTRFLPVLPTLPNGSKSPRTPKK